MPWPLNLLYYVYDQISIYCQLYHRRKKYLRTQKERERWGQINFHFMTDESDLDDDSVAQHKLPWRSESKFLKYMYCIALIFW